MPDEIEVPIETEPVAVEETTTNATEATTGDSSEPTEDKPKGGFQRKIDKLTREKADAAREAEFWRNKALETKPVEAKADEPKGEPSENDFDTHAAYVKALTKWSATQAVDEYRAQQKNESVKTQQQTVQQEFKGRQEAFRAATPDFDEVLADADIQVSNAVISEIVESDQGPALQYYLAKNPEEAKRLSALAPLALAREVGKISARFTISQEKTPAKTTGAPPPPTPTGKSTATSTKDPGEMTPGEYRVWRAKQNAK